MPLEIAQYLFSKRESKASCPKRSDSKVRRVIKDIKGKINLEVSGRLKISTIQLLANKRNDTKANPAMKRINTANKSILF